MKVLLPETGNGPPVPAETDGAVTRAPTEEDVARTGEPSVEKVDSVVLDAAAEAWTLVSVRVLVWKMVVITEEVWLAAMVERPAVISEETPAGALPVTALPRVEDGAAGIGMATELLDESVEVWKFVDLTVTVSSAEEVVTGA